MDNVNKYEIERDARIARWTKKKEDALASQNASEYVKACNSLGIEPEDEHLYERGHTEAIIHQGNSSGLEKMAGNAKNVPLQGEEGKSDFLKEAECYVGTRLGDFANEKAELLRKHFRRFRAGGSQDLGTYDNIKVCSIFKHIYNSYNSRQIKSK